MTESARRLRRGRIVRPFLPLCEKRFSRFQVRGGKVLLLDSSISYRSQQSPSRQIFLRIGTFFWKNPLVMVIGDRIRALREQKGLSQGQLEKRTGLLRCYISRVENGHTVPSIETVEKLSRALEVSLYQIFWEGEGIPAVASSSGRVTEEEVAADWSGEQAQFARRMAQLFHLLSEEDRQLLLTAAQRMAARW